jgi:hypothetical protein
VPPVGLTVEVRVALPAPHIVALFTVTTGIGLTVTLATAKAEQPLPSVYVTV